MRKALLSTCAAALLVGTTSTAFAAANPFEDVPVDHWAYDAVAQLAADGVIEGYGDGTYRGDQAITRFEMAQMVARAMAKGGGQLTFGNKVKATLTVGRSRSYAQVDASPDIADKAGETGLTGSYQAVEIYNDRADKWTWGVGFHRWANGALLWPNASTSAVNV